MTNTLRDAAENATAGVPVVAYRTDIFESLPNGKLSRLILEASEVRDPDADWTPLVPLSALDTARAEIERLTHEVESAGSLRLRMEAHRQSAEQAQSALTAAQARIAELEGFATRWIKLVEATFAPVNARAALDELGEFDDLTLRAGLMGDLYDAARATLFPAVKEPTDV